MVVMGFPKAARNPNSFGTASRTVTLDLSTWAKLYEAAQLMHIDFRPAMVKAIDLLYATQKNLAKSDIIKIPDIETN